MFSTGSHDGGVRIWTSPKEEYLHSEERVLTRGTLTPSNTPRTGSPLPYEAEYRTGSSSPSTQMARSQISLPLLSTSPQEENQGEGRAVTFS